MNFYKKLVSRNWRKLGWECYAQYPDKKVYDRDVAKFVWQHLKLRDKFDFRKIVSAVLEGFAILQDDDYKEEDYKDFTFDYDRPYKIGDVKKD